MAEIGNNYRKEEVTLSKEQESGSDVQSDNLSTAQETDIENINTEQTSEDASVFDDLFGSLMDLGIRFFLVLITAMLDCIEQTFANITYASGKNFKWVLLVVFTYIPVSLFSPLFGVMSVIPWQDSVIAFLVTLCIFTINNVTKASIEKMVTTIKNVKIKKIEGGK